MAKRDNSIMKMDKFDNFQSLTDIELTIVIFLGRLYSKINQNLDLVSEITFNLLSNPILIRYIEEWIDILKISRDLNFCLNVISRHKKIFLEYLATLSKLRKVDLFNIENDPFFSYLEGSYVSKNKGRYFTSHSLILSIFRKTKGISKFKEFPDILDPTMGSGRFFAAFLDFWCSISISQPMPNRDNLYKIIENHLFGIDLNNDVINLAKLRIYIIDLHIAFLNQDWTLPKYKFDHWINIDVLTDLVSFESSSLLEIGIYNKKTNLSSNLPFKMKKILNNRGFSLIVANPPYYKVGQSKYKSNSLYSEIKSKKSHVLNISSLFFQLGFHLVASNGYLCYVLPKGFCYNNSFEISRNESIERSIISLTDCKKGFQNVLLEQVMIVIKNQKYSEDQITNIFNFDFKKKALSTHGKIKQNFFMKYTNYKLTFYVNDIGINIFKSIIVKSISLIDVGRINGVNGNIQIFMGDSNNTKLKADSKDSNFGMADPIPILWGKILDRDEIKAKFIDKNKLTYLSERTLKKYMQKKIVIQRIIAHIKNHIKIIANYDHLGCLTVNTITNIIFEEGFSSPKSNWECTNLKYISLLLNSDLVNFVIHKFYFADAIRSMDLSATVLSKFPIPTLTLDQQSALINEDGSNKSNQEKKLHNFLGLTSEESEYILNYSIS